jgi:hypothetical protein
MAKATHPSCESTVMKCSILVTKNDGFDYWKDEPCKKNAKYIVSYRMSYHGGVYKKHCCTQHKNKLVKEIEMDDFAKLISVDNIAQPTR